MEPLARPPAGISPENPDGGAMDQDQKLKTIFPKDNRNLDALFPESEIRELLQDVVVDLGEVERFVDRMDKELKVERAGDSKKKPRFHSFSFR